MKGYQRGVVWDSWMIPALEAFGKNNGMDFSASVRYLVSSELNKRGYFQSDYQPGIVDKPADKEVVEIIKKDVIA